MIELFTSVSRFQSHVAAFCIGLAAFAGVALLGEKSSRGQTQDVSPPAGEVKRVLMPVRDRHVKSNTASEAGFSAFGLAATRNVSLRSELSWIFGGKQQLGWYLYTSLIQDLLNTEQDATSSGFASAVAAWQESSGLKPSGMLDEDSLYAMVSVWQGARLKGLADALPDQLVTAPASDFYDPSRPDELRQVERETYAAYKRLIAAAAQDSSLGLSLGPHGELASAENYLKIISSFRSREYQEHLRRQSPNSGRAGLAVNSPHFTGRALDLYVGGDPVDTKDSNRALQVQTPIYLWLVLNAKRFGFRPYFYEPWHWEYVK
jgi:D-alanyl-D-alanine carboxypeptidase